MAEGPAENVGTCLQIIAGSYDCDDIWRRFEKGLRGHLTA
jgi:hypothetical protein